MGLGVVELFGSVVTKNPVGATMAAMNIADESAYPQCLPYEKTRPEETLPEGSFTTPNNWNSWKVIGPVGNANTVQIAVAANNDAAIALSKDNNFNGAVHYVNLGSHGNKKSSFSYGQNAGKWQDEAGGLLGGLDEWRIFFLEWRDGTNLRLYTYIDEEFEQVMEMPLRDDLPINNLAVRTGWGSTGIWNINLSEEED